MGKSKKRAEDKPYLSENLESLARTLAKVRKQKDGVQSRFSVIFEELGETVKVIPDQNRVSVEKFWGLITGLDHSKMMAKRTDAAYVGLCNEGLGSMEILYKLHYAYMYDTHMRAIVARLVQKFNRDGVEISDVEVIKYLVSYLIILQNGPKMSYELKDLEVDTEGQDNFVFDEYTAILGAYKKLCTYPDNSINLKLIKDRLEMLDFEDYLTILKTFYIPFPELPKFPKFPEHPEILEEYSTKEIETVETLLQVRTLKEKIFPYGDWDVTTELVFGNKEIQEKFETFLSEIALIRNDWSKIKDFKTGQKDLMTSTGLRHLEVYSIGGLDFTDIYEVMFLYVERNCVMASVDKSNIPN